MKSISYRCLLAVIFVANAQMAFGALVLHYAFDDGNATTATNSVGTNGTYSGAGSVYSPGIVGANAVDPSNYINTNVNLGSQNQYTMSLWYNTGQGQQCCGSGGLYYTNGGWGNDSLHSSLNSGSSRIWHEIHSGAQRNSSNVATALNNWNHVVASFDNGNIVYTVNGVVDSSQTMSGPLARLDQGQIGAWNGGRIYNGKFDDWAIWTGEALNAAESTAIHNLANSSLNYNAQNADDLFGVYDGEESSASIDGMEWVAAGDGTLTGNPGDVLDLGGGDFGLILNGNGGGVQTASSAATVPEPASIAIWSLLGLAGFGYGCFRRRRNS